MSELGIQAPEVARQWDLDLFVDEERDLDRRWQSVRSYLERSRVRPRAASGVIDYGLVTLTQSPDGRQGMWTVYFWEELSEVRTPHGDVVRRRSVHAEVNRHHRVGVIEPEAVFDRPAWITTMSSEGVSEGIDNRHFLESVPAELLDDDQQNWDHWLGAVEGRIAIDSCRVAI